MTFQTRISIGQVYAMYAYYKEGHGLRMVSRKFGVSTDGVYKCFIRHNLHIRSKSHSLKVYHNIDAETKMMYADYQSGMSLRQIAAKYSLSVSGIRHRFKSSGYKSRLVGSGRAA